GISVDTLHAYELWRLVGYPFSVSDCSFARPRTQEGVLDMVPRLVKLAHDGVGLRVPQTEKAVLTTADHPFLSESPSGMRAPARVCFVEHAFAATEVARRYAGCDMQEGTPDGLAGWRSANRKAASGQKVEQDNAEEIFSNLLERQLQQHQE
ncbi:unnamed protein product, partial [Hapterophycus canaliculatus]